MTSSVRCLRMWGEGLACGRGLFVGQLTRPRTRPLPSNSLEFIKVSVVRHVTLRRTLDAFAFYRMFFRLTICNELKFEFGCGRALW